MKIKKIYIIFIIAVLMLSFSNIVFATEDKTITGIANEWISTGERQEAAFNTNISSEGFQNIAGLLLGIGIFVAAGVGIILGIKFMLSTPTGKAEVSSLLPPFIIGVAVIVGALTIWRIAVQFLDI